MSTQPPSWKKQLLMRLNNRIFVFASSLLFFVQAILYAFLDFSPINLYALELPKHFWGAYFVFIAILLLIGAVHPNYAWARRSMVIGSVTAAFWTVGFALTVFIDDSLYALVPGITWAYIAVVQFLISGYADPELVEKVSGQIEQLDHTNQTTDEKLK